MCFFLEMSSFFINVNLKVRVRYNSFNLQCTSWKTEGQAWSWCSPGACLILWPNTGGHDEKSARGLSQFIYLHIRIAIYPSVPWSQRFFLIFLFFTKQQIRVAKLCSSLTALSCGEKSKEEKNRGKPLRSTRVPIVKLLLE